MLLASNLTAKKSDCVLEIGIGSGYVSLTAARDAKIVVGTDTNIHAVKLAKLNAKLNNTTNVDFVLGDLFGPIGERFDLVLINPPYLPRIDEVNRKHIDSSWDGGEDGREVSDRFLKGVEKYLNESGRILMIQSSISDHKWTLRTFLEKGFQVRTISEERVFFETLYLMEAKRPKQKSSQKKDSFHTRDLCLRLTQIARCRHVSKKRHNH
jgi:release factor glutamine methyltransferase